VRAESRSIQTIAASTSRSRALLLTTTDVIGSEFNTQAFALFLYALARMQRPAIALELGTGFGITSYWLALAARENGSGHVYTIDDARFLTGERFVRAMRGLLAAGVLDRVPATSGDYFREMTGRLGLTSAITHIDRGIDLTAADHFSGYPFAGQPVDLVFADFAHGPDAVLLLVAHLLPLLSPGGSIFIDSASTYWPSYLLLEQITAMFNRGEVPESLSRRGHDLERHVRRRRFTLIHVTKQDDSAQNGVAWLKMDPIDIIPHPMTAMRNGPFAANSSFGPAPQV
jgi:predicted O-methyltransferase YrrM